VTRRRDDDDRDDEPRCRPAPRCWGLDYCGADDCERCRPGAEDNETNDRDEEEAR